MDKNQDTLPLPDKKIPTSIMIIGTLEIAIGLLGFIILFLVGEVNILAISILILYVVYVVMGTGLWAIQEWARYSNVILHMVAIPYISYTYFFLEFSVLGASQVSATVLLVIRLTIAIGIIYALTRPEIKYKFQTAVPKNRV